MPTIGKSKLFPAAVVMREVAALASYCDENLPSVQKLVICTTKKSRLEEYQRLFEGPGWKEVLKESQVFEICRLVLHLFHIVCCCIRVTMTTIMTLRHLHIFLSSTNIR